MFDDEGYSSFVNANAFNTLYLVARFPPDSLYISHEVCWRALSLSLSRWSRIYRII